MMSDLATIGKILSHKTNRAGLLDILGSTGDINVQGEVVQKLDVFANELCKSYLGQTGHFLALSSEEEDGVVDLSEKNPDAKYVIAFDPLDGSSNIDVNVSVGTIFSVHKVLEGKGASDPAHFLQAGNTQVLAGYLLYGSSTVVVFTFGDGVYEFTFEPSIGEFFLSSERVRVPEKCSYYSVNEANAPHFRSRAQTYVESLKKQGCSARYIGSFVADVHRNLRKGGVFLYPAVDKGNGEYKAKLRLNFEAKPLAFVVQQAGGLAISDTMPILDIVPQKLHERVSLVIGNTTRVQEYAMMKE